MSFFLVQDFQVAKTGDFIYIGLALYQQKWHFSGIMLECPSEKIQKALLERTKDHVAFQLLVPELKESMENTISNQNRDFKQFQPEGPLVFKLGSELPAYTQRFLEFSVSKAQRDKSVDGSMPTSSNLPGENPKDAKTTFMLFFNSKQGMELHPGPYCGIPHPDNRDFDPNKDQEKAMRLFLMEDSTSVELCHYVLDTFRSQFSFVKSKTFRPFVEDLDFILRFKKAENYGQVPQVLITNFNGD